MSQPHFENRSETASSPAGFKMPELAVRILIFVLVTIVIWGGYFFWRPPAPMLGIHVVTSIPPERSQVSLTFDDGPHPLSTPLLLGALKRADAKATFFVVGHGMKLYPQLALRILEDGHTLANHSQHHINLTKVTAEDYPVEIDKGFAAIKTAGADTLLFRPPGGGLDRAAMDYLYRNNITLAWWTNNVGDWMPLPAWKIARHVNNTLRPGDIVLMHDAGTSTPQSLPIIVREARKRGLEFVPMPERIDREK
jgi:peptidoglycan/xylan/chitin deacetylase (PgdA/CDA1 family)